MSVPRLVPLPFAFAGAALAGPMDRQALVTRPNVALTQTDALSPLSVGNGNFAFTADITGLQTFPDAHTNGTPLHTLSQWGWHSSPNPEDCRLEDTLQIYDVGVARFLTSARKRTSGPPPRRNAPRARRPGCAPIRIAWTSPVWVSRCARLMAQGGRAGFEAVRIGEAPAGHCTGAEVDRQSSGHRRGSSPRLQG